MIKILKKIILDLLICAIGLIILNYITTKILLKNGRIEQNENR